MGLKRLLATALIFMLGACATAPPPPAISYAWVRFDDRAIVASGARGMADAQTARPLTLDDPVRIASISKLVVALGLMKLVEEGRLDLDRDVSHWLGWTLRNPAYPGDQITLRMLLSHQSSLRDGVDYAIPLGVELQDILQGQEAFDAEHRPGSYFRYGNLNFPVVATVMEAATGERFDLLMRRLVPALAEVDACFNWPTCSERAIGKAVVLYSPDGAVLRDDLVGRRPDCPVVPAAGGSCDWRSYEIGTNGALFSPQGGLRVSARGLAVIGQMLLNGGFAEMTKAQWRFDGTNGDTEGGFYCAYGLGVQILAQSQAGCRDDLFGDGGAAFGHAGDAYGLRSGLWIDPETRKGVAYFATGIAEDAPRGRSAYRTIEEWLARRR